MKKILKLCGFLLASSALFVIIASLAFIHLIRVGELRAFLITQLEEQTGFEVSLGKGELELGWLLGFGFRELALSEPAASQPAIRAERITARVALLPLLRRKLVFYEVRLLRPSLQMTRDEDGRIPLLDKILNLPLMQRHGSEFQFDLRSVRVQGGQIEWTDHRPAGEPVTFRLLRADAEVKRLPAVPPKDPAGEVPSADPQEWARPALQFAVHGILEKGQHRSGVSAKGRLGSGREVLEFRSASWSADVELGEVPAELVLAYAGTGLALKSLNGRFASRLHINGRPSERLQIVGDLEFRETGIDAPVLLASPLLLGDGRVSFALDWSPQRLAFSKFDFRSAEANFTLQGEARNLRGEDPQFQLSLSAPPLSVTAVKKFLTAAGGGSQVGRWAASLQDGRLHLKRAGLDASLSQMRSWVRTGVDERLWFDAELRNVAVKLDTDGALPLYGLAGRIVLDKGVFTLTGLKANYGNSRLNGIEARYTPGQSGFSLRGGGDVDLAELRDQLKLGVFPLHAAEMVSSLQELGGMARADLSLHRFGDGPLQISGILGLENARLRKDDYLLTEVKGALAFNPGEIRGEKIRASLSGSPIQIDLHVKNYASPEARFDLRVDSSGMKAGVLARLLLQTGSPEDSGLVRGAVRYTGAMAEKGDRRLIGTLDLINVQLAVQPLLQPLRELNGRINIDESGIDFQNLRGLLVGFPSRVDGRWRYAETPQLVFDFAAPQMDVSHLISQVDPESTEFYANLQAKGRVALAAGRLKAFEFSDLTAAVTLDRRIWRLYDLAARSAGGSVRGSTILADRPGLLGITAQSGIQGVPVESFLHWFDATTTEMTGKVNLTGNLTTSGNDDLERKENVNGAFNLKIEDGTIKRMRILVQILNLLDLSRWFTLQLPDLSKDGIRFRNITGDFKVTKGVYFTDNLVVDSDDLRMTGSGKIDSVKDEIEFVVAVRPFAGIDSVINYIPLLGRGIAAIKNSFLVASFNINGPIDNPIITPAPLGTLAEWFWGVLGIPKNMIGLGEGGRKDGGSGPQP